MRLYVVLMGENFEEVKANQGHMDFESLQDAKTWCQLNLAPGQKFMLCDENGGLLLISQVPRIVGKA